MKYNTFSLEYSPQLDGLRGIAILIVLVHHAGIPLINGGYIGVDIFFVLSGFLITALLCQEHQQAGRISLKNFYIRRVLRLLPALLLVLFIFGIYALLTKSGSNLKKAGKAIFYTITYLSDIAQAFGFSTMEELSHSWSLSMEEHFYLIFPVCLILLYKFKLKSCYILTAINVAILAVVIYRAITFQAADGDYTALRRFYFGFDYRFDALLTGCSLGFLIMWRGLPQIRSLYFILAVFVLTYTIIFIPAVSPVYYYGMPLLNICTAVILIYILQERPKFLANPVIVWIGAVSYGLYLWHGFVFYVVHTYLHLSTYPLLITGSMISFAFTALSYYWVEKPCLKLKNHFKPS